MFELAFLGASLVPPVARTENTWVPPTCGVPEIYPVDTFMERPGGRL